MNPSFPGNCPKCGSTDKPMIIQRETEFNFVGDIHRVSSPATQCNQCGAIWHGPGHNEALRQSVRDADSAKHGLSKSHPTHREMNLLRAAIEDYKSERDRLIPWLTANTPQAQKYKKEHQERLLEIFAREQKLSQEFDELANLRGEEFDRLTQKIKQFEAEISTHTAKLKEAHALLEIQQNDLKQAEISVKKAESETRAVNSELKLRGSTIAKLERKIEKLKPGSDEFEKQISRLKSQLAAQKEKRKSVESDHERSKSEVTKLKQNIGEIERESRLLENRYVREQKLLERERAKLNKLHEKLNSAEEMSKKNSAAKDAFERAEGRLRRKDRQLEEANEKIKALISQAETTSIFHLTDERVISWLSNVDGRSWEVPEYATMLGEGPIFWNQMRDHLLELGCEPYLSGCEWIIVGRDDCHPEELDKLIEEREGKNLKIVSQELFIVAAISGQDPFMADEEILLAFAEGHPALQHLLKAGFEWPFMCEWIEEEPETYRFMGAEKSPLKEMGYTVGERGLYEDDRREILTNSFKGELEWVESQEYMELWGTPGTRHRLRQIVYHISRQIPKHRGMYNHDTAVREWEEDLEWLYYEFYKPWMRFRWPGSDYD